MIISKLDGTARGGMVFSVAQELKLPIHYVGTGEKMEDFVEFYPEDFVDGLFAA